MKKIELTIRPSKLEDVKKELVAIGIHGMTYFEARGFGRQGGHTENYRGKTYQVDFLPKFRVEIVVHDEALEKVIETIMQAAKTGSVGDGKIFVSDITDAWRIRTGDRGDAAL